MKVTTAAGASVASKIHLQVLARRPLQWPNSQVFEEVGEADVIDAAVVQLLDDRAQQLTDRDIEFVVGAHQGCRHLRTASLE